MNRKSWVTILIGKASNEVRISGGYFGLLFQPVRIVRRKSWVTSLAGKNSKVEIIGDYPSRDLKLCKEIPLGMCGTFVQLG